MKTTMHRIRRLIAWLTSGYMTEIITAQGIT